MLVLGCHCHTWLDQCANLSPANISADVFPKASKVTPAIFCDRPRVLEIMNSAGHRLCTSGQ